MRRDIERPLRWVQTRDDIETRLVDGTFRFLRVLEGDADLIRKLGTFIALEVRLGLGEIVLEEVEEGRIVILGDAFVAYEESAVLDQRICCLCKARSYRWGNGAVCGKCGEQSETAGLQTCFSAYFCGPPFCTPGRPLPIPRIERGRYSHRR